MSLSMSSSKALLQLYKKLLRSSATYPSKNREKIYQAIREEWRENKTLEPQEKRDKQIAVAYKGLEQLRQFDEYVMSSGKGPSSPSWEVTLEQNPMPKPADYDERKAKKKR
jgi:hypothetical protein